MKGRQILASQLTHAGQNYIKALIQKVEQSWNIS